MHDLITALTRGELIPRFAAGILPVPAHEREIVMRMDGLRTVHELSTADVDVTAVCHLVLELVWFGAVVLEEVVVASASEARVVAAPRPDAETPSPLVHAVVAHCASA